jgi:hypothetical protein
MCDTFGDRYREYARRTGRLFPRLRSTAEPAPVLESAAGPVADGERCGLD